MPHIDLSTDTLTRLQLLARASGREMDLNSEVSEETYAILERLRRPGESDDSLLNRLASFAAQRPDSPFHTAEDH